MTTLLLKNVFIDQSCVDGLVHLLNNSSLIKLKIDRWYFSTNELFDDLITAITNSELKQLELFDLGIDLKMLNKKEVQNQNFQVLIVLLTLICHSTKSFPVTISVTGCSTCNLVFISMK